MTPRQGLTKMDSKCAHKALQVNLTSNEVMLRHRQVNKKLIVQKRLAESVQLLLTR